MKKTSSQLRQLSNPLLILLFLIAAAAMAAEPEKQEVLGSLGTFLCNRRFG